jgi:hypothetical protein
MMVLQFVSSARFKFLNRPFGTDLVYHFPPADGLWQLSSFIFAHPILLFILDSSLPSTY